jgi:hypothetical protein
MTIEASAESGQLSVEPSRIEPNFLSAEPEILLPIEQCFEYKEVRFGNQVLKVPVSVKVHKTADEVLKLIPLATVEETGAMLYYKDGVYLEGGDAVLRNSEPRC